MRCETDLPGGISPCDGVRWGRVEAKARRALIVATGPSVEALDLSLVTRAARAGVHVIAVNGAIEWLPVAHSWFTLDPGRLNRPRMASQKTGTVYYAAVPDDYGTEAAECSLHRAPPENGVTFLRRLAGRRGLSEEASAIVSGNSAFGALGLAWLMGAERIALLGVDGTRERYAFGATRPTWNLRHLPGLFRSAVPQLMARGAQVANGSPTSTVTCFRRCRPNEAIEWVVE